jgi:peptidyl-tRNA hydrolase
VGGTDVPVDPEPHSHSYSHSQPELGAANEGVLRVWTPTEPVMTLGKAMAQAGHAGMIAAAMLADADQPALHRWAQDGCPAVVRRSAPDQWAALLDAVSDERRGWAGERLLAVRDAGFTEIAAGTVTAVATAPR